MAPARLVLAGTQSGVGKTTLVAGLLAAWRARGLAVQPFKVGPDYIDPTYHTLAAGRTCRNLDAWLVPTHVASIFARASRDADVALVEGVMGLFDGFDYDDDTGSTADVARRIEAPVVIVIDAAKQARSAAALARGFQTFAANLPVAGFLVNRVGSPGHGAGVARAIEKATGLPVFGWLPRDQGLQVPERHLGLVPTLEPGRWQDFLDAARRLIDAHLDLDRLLACCPRTELPPIPEHAFHSPLTTQHSPRIAVARDEAFHFTYPENIELLEAAGAEVCFFSPLRDEALPAGTVGILLSGGFPEVFAGPLSANTKMIAALRNAHERGLPIYAECGGLMYLTQSIVDLDGVERRMVGLLPGRSRMTGQLTLGYRLAESAGDGWLFRAGEQVRGHEFHYSVWEDRPEDLPAAYRLVPPRGDGPTRPDGARLGNLFASYVHLHFLAFPELARRFVCP
ncbi:MAG: cobyrinate a,c-diamide synthase [Gemmataceae bacterium]